MKQGTTLVKLAEEIQRQNGAKADFIADTRQLHMESIRDMPRLVIEGHGYFGMTSQIHRQIGDRLNIPARYYDLMLAQAPDLLAENINHWFASSPDQRMIRTLDGDARAFLSRRYRPLDNYDLAEAVLPTLTASGAAIHSCEITPERMYIKGVVDAAQVTVPPPDAGRSHGARHQVVVSPGIVISNSEIGHGALKIQPAVHFLSCTNMATWAQHALRKHHVGRDFGNGGNGGYDGDSVWQFLSDETRQLTDAAVWSQVRDIARGALEGPVFDAIVSELQAARTQGIGKDVPAAVERLAERKVLTADEGNGILNHLIQGGDLSRFGLSNAITRFSQEVEDYQRATALEELGGEVIAMSRTDWGALVN